MRSLALLTLAASALAGSAKADPADTLSEALRSACRPGAVPADLHLSPQSHYGRIAAADVADALEAAYPGRADLLMGRPVDPRDTRTNPAWLADQAYASVENPSDAQAALAATGRFITEWMEDETITSGLPLRGGGVRIVAPGRKPAEVLLQVMTGDDKGLTLVCRYPSPSPQEPGPDRLRLRLVKTPGDLDTPKRKHDGAPFPDTYSFAEFAYADDRQTRTQAWGVAATAALEWPEFLPGGEGGYLHWTPRLYLAYERKGESDPAVDGYVNNLTLGGRVTGDLGLSTDWFGYYSLSAMVESDDHLKSEAYAAEVRIDPPLPPMPYHRYMQKLHDGPRLRAFAQWDVDLVADWRQIDDPGRKTALKDAAEYVRLGYDAGFRVRIGPSAPREDWGIALAVAYSVRDGQTGDGGDAQLFTSSLAFEPSAESRVTFGLSYERGENLTSFESSELWKLFFGVRY